MKLSRDARDWETVYDNKSFSGVTSGVNIIEFKPKRAKQIWVIGQDIPGPARRAGSQLLDRRA